MSSLSFFFRLFSWFIIRPLGRSWGRTLTVVIGVAMGAAVFAGVRLSVHASLDSFHRSLNAITGTADYVVSVPGDRISETLVAPLLKDPLVDAASPLSSTYVAPGETEAPFLLIGVDPILDRPLREWDASDFPNPSGGAWLDLIRHPFTFMATSKLARRLEIAPGGALSLSAPAAELRLAGIMADEGLAAAEGGMVAVCDMATFQELTETIGFVDRIDLRLKPQATALDIRALERRLPEGVELRPASQMRESGQVMIRAYQLNLSILSFASLFVGMFLVYSLVALNAASRRREIAVLRAMGAPPGLIFALFLGEGTALGAIGWMAAIPISALLLPYLLHGVSETVSTLFVRAPVEGLSLSVWEVALSFAVTVLVSALAAVQPAREAMQVPPREAIDEGISGVLQKRSPGRLAAAGFFLIALVYPLASAPGPPGVPLPGYAATAMLFSGFALTAPWIIRAAGRFLSPPLKKLAGMPAFLAGRYMSDSGARTAVSVGALITAVALFVSLVIMIHSFRETVKLWVEQTVSGDLFIAARMAEVNDFRDPMTEAEMNLLRGMDDFADIVGTRRFSLQYDGAPYQLEALEMDAFLKHGAFVWMEDESERTVQALIRGEGVVVSEVFSNRTGLTAGDVWHETVRTETLALPVLAVIRDYRTRAGVVFCDLSVLQERFPDLRWTGARLYLKSDAAASAGDLRDMIIRKGGRNLDMVLGRALRGEILRIFDETFAVTTVLLVIALTVAALGIATTLTILVLERRRELNTMYAVGGSLGQIRAMILWESLMMVCAGELAGLACGLALSTILIYVINPQSFGWTFLYRVNWNALALSLPLVTAVAAGAAVPAVHSLFRSPPATILRGK